MFWAVSLKYVYLLNFYTKSIIELLITIIHMKTQQLNYLSPQSVLIDLGTEGGILCTSSESGTGSTLDNFFKEDDGLSWD